METPYGTNDFVAQFDEQSDGYNKVDCTSVDDCIVSNLFSGDAACALRDGIKNESPRVIAKYSLDSTRTNCAYIGAYTKAFAAKQCRGEFLDRMRTKHAVPSVTHVASSVSH